jgi:hypothetical protein
LVGIAIDQKSFPPLDRFTVFARQVETQSAEIWAAAPERTVSHHRKTSAFLTIFEPGKTLQNNSGRIQTTVEDNDESVGGEREAH